MDILYGTYEVPVRGEIPTSGLSASHKVPRDPMNARFEPLTRMCKPIT